MNKEFIPYEQALEMFELGFRETCMKWYDGIRLIDEYANNTGHWDLNCAAAPLYQQAFRWFRENHNLASYIESVELAFEDGYLYKPEIHKSDVFFEKYIENYEEAEVICLKKLIEIVKNK